MAALWSFVFEWLPGPVQALILGLLAFLILKIIFKVIAMVLDAIPFL